MIRDFSMRMVEELYINCGRIDRSIIISCAVQSCMTSVLSDIMVCMVLHMPYRWPLLMSCKVTQWTLLYCCGALSNYEIQCAIMQHSQTKLFIILSYITWWLRWFFRHRGFLPVQSRCYCPCSRLYSFLHFASHQVLLSLRCTLLNVVLYTSVMYDLL